MLELLVAQVRMKKGVSIRALAREAGISKSHVERIEAGQTNPTLEVMCRIAWALEVPITDLFCYEP